jgi:biotin operon repressor
MYKENIIGKSPESKALSTQSVARIPLPTDEYGRTCLNPLNHPDIQENAAKCIDTLIKTDKNVLNSLFILKSNYLVSGEKFKHLQPSQEKIGKMVGLSRKAVNESIERLFNLGLIGKLYRHKRPCLYTLNGLLLDPELRPQLIKSLPALSWIPRSTMLISLLALSWNGDGRSLPHGFFNGGLHNIYIRNKELSNSREIYKKQAKSSRQSTAYLPEADNVLNAVPNFFYKKEAGRAAFYQDTAILANDSLPLRQSPHFGSQYSNQLPSCKMLPVSMARLLLKDINKKRTKTDEERVMEATIPSYVESIY